MKPKTCPCDLQKLAKTLHSRLPSHIRKSNFGDTRLPKMTSTQTNSTPDGHHAQLRVVTANPHFSPNTRLSLPQATDDTADLTVP